VLEVGLGGRLDAVNVVDRVLSVITPIGIDHERYLGSTLSAIATEKAGVIQRDVPVVSAPQSPVAWDVIEAQARTMNAPLAQAPPFPSTLPPGTYQRVNVATAAAALQVLRRAGFGVGVDHLARACREFRWPGRYQWLGDVLLDGAHNGHGVEALLTALDNDAQARSRAVHLVATVLADKDPAVVLEPLTKRAATVQLVPTGSMRSRTAAGLRGLGHPVTGGISQALVDAGRRASTDGGFVLVAGSLFLVADALAVLTGAPRDPPVDG
jgi:dihydrofolate synthase/folylpolyglutamate synthase